MSVVFPTEQYRLPFHLRNYIETIRDELLPPVGNKMIYGKGCQLKVMVVGGPNIRTDYHINQGEEWFYQLRGDMCLKIVKNGIFQDVVIREGDQYLLPGNTPHSPQRLPNTLGLVIERVRKEGELDGLRWYCRKCHSVLHEEFFPCEDLGTQLKGKITDYYASEEKRTCKHCHTIDRVPNVDANAMQSVTDILKITRPDELSEAELTEMLPSPISYASKFISSGVKVNTSIPQPVYPSEAVYEPPFSLDKWVEAYIVSDNEPDIPDDRKITAFGHLEFMKDGKPAKSEFLVQLAEGPMDNDLSLQRQKDHEIFYYQLIGDLTIHVIQETGTKDIIVQEGECVLIPPHLNHITSRHSNTYGLTIENRAISC